MRLNRLLLCLFPLGLLATSCGSSSTATVTTTTTATTIAASTTTIILTARYTINNWEIGPGFFSTNADLENENLTDFDFSDSWLNRALLSNVKASGAKFDRAKLQGVEFVGADLRDTSWTAADLSCDDLLLCTNFTNANLSGADFSGAILGGGGDGILFIDANLTNANFKGAKVGGSNATGAVFKNTICTDGTNSDDKPKYKGFPQGCL